MTQTRGLALALVLTIAFGIGSNAAVYGFVRGLLAHDLPLPNPGTLVAVLGVDAQGESGHVSYDDYLSIKRHDEVFEWVGTARESQSTFFLSGRSSIVPVAAVTRDIAALFQFPSDSRAVISQRMWQTEWQPTADVNGETIRIDGVDAPVAAVAPEWLEGLYTGRPVDIWMPLSEPALQDDERSSRSFWVIARLRAGISNDQAQELINADRREAGGLRVLPYTGMTPDLADGLSRISALLRAAAAAVFLIACANVVCLLLSRASARSQETSVRVALGASRSQLARQLLSDSVLISAAGGALGMLLAMWTISVVPALFFDRDAAQLVFAPDFAAIIVVSAVCVSITIVCGLVPLVELRHDRPAAVLQRENAGSSKSMRRLRTGLVVVQMACCCMLVIATGLLLESVRLASHTNVGRRLQTPILATTQSRPGLSRAETAASGFRYFRAVEDAARSVTGVTPRAWVTSLPGGLPAWQRFRVEPSRLPVREVTLDVVAFTPATLAHVMVPPMSGRLFGGQDTPQACRVAIVNTVAARDVFGGDAVGQSIDDPAGQQVEIVGVIAAREGEDATDQIRPTIYYYADQTDIPVAAAGPARFRIPVRPQLASATLDSNVVSAGYFETVGWTLERGSLFSDDIPSGCRVGVVNQEAAERYFGGDAVGAAVVDQAGRRTRIIGVVRSAPLRTLQRRVEPAIYFPMSQDFLRGMTLILDAGEVSEAILADIHRRLEAVPGRGPAPVVVRTLDSHLSRTALAPLRLATTLVSVSAATAVALGVLGLYGAMSDSARRRRREIAVRVALGAPGWRVIRQVVTEGARLAGAGAIAGVLGSILVARWLAGITPNDGLGTGWAWVAAPLVLIGAVAVASVLPARRALTVDPITIIRVDK